MKNQNGSGSVYKVPGSRRKPWVVRVTIGFEIVDGNKKQIRKLLSSYKTEREAQKTLLSYGDGLIYPEKVGIVLRNYNKPGVISILKTSSITLLKAI